MSGACSVCGAECHPGIMCRSCYEAERDAWREVRQRLAEAIADGNNAEADRLVRLASEFLGIRRPPLES